MALIWRPIGFQLTTLTAVGIDDTVRAGQVSQGRQRRELGCREALPFMTDKSGRIYFRQSVAGYDISDRVAAERGVRILMQES